MYAGTIERQKQVVSWRADIKNTTESVLQVKTWQCIYEILIVCCLKAFKLNSMYQSFCKRTNGKKTPKIQLLDNSK